AVLTRTGAARFHAPPARSYRTPYGERGGRMAAVGYVAVLRRNRDFRRLWYGQAASQVGDWLDAIALYALLLRLTGSATALGGLTWSVTLAGGAALGGLVAGGLGAEAAFLLDALSFLLSAAFSWAVNVRETHLEGRRTEHPLRELREGLVYLLTRRDVALY